MMALAELRKYLPSRHRNTLFGEITLDLVDDIVVTRINHAGHHDLEGVDSATLLRQTKLGSGPEAKSHVAAGVQAIRGVGGELHSEIPRGFRDSVRHFWFLLHGHIFGNSSRKTAVLPNTITRNSIQLSKAMVAILYR
jgi:hypothetical protein